MKNIGIIMIFKGKQGKKTACKRREIAWKYRGSNCNLVVSNAIKNNAINKVIPFRNKRKLFRGGVFFSMKILRLIARNIEKSEYSNVW